MTTDKIVALSIGVVFVVGFVICIVLDELQNRKYVKKQKTETQKWLQDELEKPMWRVSATLVSGDKVSSPVFEPRYHQITYRDYLRKTSKDLAEEHLRHVVESRHGLFDGSVYHMSHTIACAYLEAAE
jgi:hypothetical protein